MLILVFFVHGSREYDGDRTLIVTIGHTVVYETINGVDTSYR